MYIYDRESGNEVSCINTESCFPLPFLRRDVMLWFLRVGGGVEALDEPLGAAPLLMSWPRH